MPRGSAPGERRGGRQKGTLNKKNAEVQAKALAEGIAPLDVMLDNMRFHHEKAGKLMEQCFEGLEADQRLEAVTLLKGVIGSRDSAQQAARDAAPYLHPKLSNIEHTGKDGGAIETAVTVIERILVRPNAKD